jgi:multiphosphoryl transfer protein
MHMKAFSILARKMMHEDFRDRLVAAADSATVVGILQEEVLSRIATP